MPQNNNNSSYVILAIVAIIAVVALVFFLQPRDEPSTQLGRAVEEMAEGIDDAANEFGRDKTAGEKLGDAVEDLGDDIGDASR